MNTTATNTNQIITLEEIAQRKTELRKEIAEQKSRITITTRNIFAPLIPSPSGNPLMKSFNTGLAIFDGVMMGFKIIKSIKRYFRNR